LDAPGAPAGSLRVGARVYRILGAAALNRVSLCENADSQDRSPPIHTSV
jgi:hypothetical protein